MKKEYTICKEIFFNTKEEADRFISLYGGSITDVDDSYIGNWTRNYYGDSVKGMFNVSFRSTTKEFNKIKEAILLKEKKGINGRKYYVMA